MQAYMLLHKGNPGNNFLLCTKALPEDTLAGGDFNVVPDVTIDVQNRNPLAYDNKGIKELTKMMRHASLIDERREQLGKEIEPTRITPMCSTRLDRWYVPSKGKMGEHLWTYDTTNTFIFKKNSSDHLGVTLHMENQVGELGHDRVTIRENLIAEREVQDQIIKLLNESYQKNGNNTTKWTRAMNMIRDFLIKETKMRKKREAPQIKRPGCDKTKK